MTNWSNRPENRLSVAEAAYQWTYVITKQKFEEVTGIKIEYEISILSDEKRKDVQYNIN